MFRVVASKVLSLARPNAKPQLLKSLTATGVHNRNYSVPNEAPSGMSLEEELLAAVQSEEISGYEIRSIVTEIQGVDRVLGPDLIEALMYACRRNNDYALCIRILECVKFKCGNDTGLYNNLMSQVQPTLDKLGILNLEQMGYDKPELHLKSVFDIHD